MPSPADPFAFHVAGIGMLWRASERSVRLSVRNALRLAKDAGFRSLAMPTIGAGTGGLSEERVVSPPCPFFGMDDVSIDPGCSRFHRHMNRIHHSIDVLLYLSPSGIPTCPPEPGQPPR